MIKGLYISRQQNLRLDLIVFLVGGRLYFYLINSLKDKDSTVYMLKFYKAINKKRCNTEYERTVGHSW